MRLHQLLLVHELGVRVVHAVVGASVGGMQALEWAIMYPALVRRAVVMVCCAAQSAWQLAISELQRQSIYRDPEWNLSRLLCARHATRARPRGRAAERLSARDTNVGPEARAAI